MTMKNKKGTKYSIGKSPLYVNLTAGGRQKIPGPGTYNMIHNKDDFMSRSHFMNTSSVSFGKEERPILRNKKTVLHGPNTSFFLAQVNNK